MGDLQGNSYVITSARMRVIVSVTNDLSTDQRVDKTCRSILSWGHEVEAIGRSQSDNTPLARPYGHERMELIFRKGPLFYAEYNLKLYFNLKKQQADVFIANDLDTLLATYMAAKAKGIPLIYDSHEYFTEVPELQGRWAKKVWTAIETRIFPKLKYVYTVNESIAKAYHDKYKVPVKVLRNLPQTKRIEKRKTREELGLPLDKKILILQGAGINVNRGGEELIEAMTLLPSEFMLLVIGAGDVYDDLVQRAKKLGLKDKVRFYPRMPYVEMMQYTLNADIGLTLDKDDNLNYQFSLPNKLFDYIAAGIPVFSSRLVELERIINQYDIGY